MKLRHLLALAALLPFFGNLGYSADDLTAQDKYNTLVEKGIFSGMTDTSGFDQDMTRAQFARVSALILGLEGNDNRGSSHMFTDVSSEWAAGYVAAALDASIFRSSGEGQFDPSGKFSTTAHGIGSLFPKSGGGNVVAALSGTIRYTSPEGTVTLINIGNGAIVNADGSVAEVATLKDLIAREAQNGTAGSTESLTAALNAIVTQIAAKVGSGEYGEAGPAVLATVVSTLSQANPAAATTYAQTAINSVATSTTLTADQKKSAATLVTQRAVAALPPQERAGALAQLNNTLATNASNLGLSSSEIATILATSLNPVFNASDSAPAGSQTIEIGIIDVTVVSPSS